MQFDNKVAIITGAASGMGLLTAQQLAGAGAKVVLTDVNEDALKKAVTDINNSGGQAIEIEVDVREYAQIQNAVDTTLEKYGRIDYLFNFAGGAETRMCKCQKPFHELPVEVIDWGLDVNLKGVVYFCRAVLGVMIEQKSGVIINLASVSGVEASGAVCYGASKSGIIHMTKSLAKSAAPHGVRICCVSPGPVLTRAEMAEMPTPMGRAAQPQEVVDLVLYLCSEKASFITGTNYLIDGGRCC